MMARFLGNFAMLVVAASSLGAQEKKPSRIPGNVRVIRDLEYAKPEGRPLLLDLYLPKEASAELLPAVIWVHGGGWKNGSKKNCKASWLAAEGFAVASINYRLTDAGVWPAQIDDCYAAVRWLRRNAGPHGIDPSAIGAWGSSAGGHLVALMATRPYPGKEQVSSRVQAVCDWFGPADLLTMPPNVVGNGRTEADVADSNGARLLDGTVRDQPEKARDASALHHVSEGDTPVLIMHGEKDPGVPLEQSARFHKALVSAGVPVSFHVVEGAGHGGPEFNSPDVRARVLDFFRRHLSGSETKKKSP
jgi:acetyl esterase/lipase